MSLENRRNIQMASLKVSNKTFPLYKGLNLIGRSKQATVALKNENVSQHQAIITIIDENQHFLSDVFSSNGTTLNKNKLHPLTLYELQQDSNIEFAKVAATYKKVPEVVNQSDNLQNTQSVDDSFYLADTQSLDITPIPPMSDAHHNGYFDDGYDFNNLPSPPSFTIISPRKTDISIHEMATQLYHPIDVKNMESEIEISKTGTQMTIHDLPTQLMFEDVAANVCIVQEEEIPNDVVVPPSTQLSIHSQPTQLLHCTQNEHLDDSRVCETQENPPENESYLDASKDLIDQTAINDSGIEACNSKTDRSSTLIECTPCKETTRMILHPYSKHMSENNETTLELHASQEIVIQKKKCRPIISDSEGDSETASLQGTNIHLTTENSQSQEIGYRKKPLRPIESSCEDDAKTMPNGSLEEAIGQYNKRCRKLSSDSENNDEQPADNPSTTRHREHSKIDSDSETDIELESDITCKGNEIDSGSETENELSTSKVLDDQQSLKGAVNNMSICDDSKKLCSNNETLFIPATQCSDDDSNDFNFMPENTGVRNSKTKNDTGNTQGSVLDVSQKLRELQPHNFLQQNCSVESIHFGLTDAENTEESVSKSNNSRTSNNGTIVSDMDEVTQKIDDKLEQNNTSDNKVSTNDSDDIFIQPTQECITGDKKLSFESCDIYDRDTQKIDDANASSNGDIFMQSTQKLVESDTPNMQSCNTDNLFRSSTPSNLHDDDIFLQATQKMDSKNTNDTDLFLKPLPASSKRYTTPKSPDDDDDIFMQATQELSFQKRPNNDDDIFLQATQELPGTSVNQAMLKDNYETVQRKNLVVNQNIFINPTKKTTYNEAPEDDDIFLQPTQALIVSQPLKDDASVPPQNPSCVEENIFLQPTQELHGAILAADDNTNTDNDVFLQPGARSFLSLLHIFPEETNKDDDVQSQLEVLFSSQTVKLCSQVNTRPQNPLVNILEEAVEPVEDDDSRSSDGDDEDFQFDHKIKHTPSKKEESISHSNKKGRSVNIINEQNITLRNKMTRINLNINSDIKVDSHKDLRTTKEKSTKSNQHSKNLKTDSTPTTSVFDTAATKLTAKQTKTRNRYKNLDNDHSEQSDVEVQSTTTRRKAKNNLNSTDDTKTAAKTRNTCRNLDSEQPTPHASTTSDAIVQSTTNRRKAKNKLISTDDTETVAKTRNTQRNLDNKSTEQPTPHTSTTSDVNVQSTTNRRKMKNKQIIDDESTATNAKRVKFEPALETPVVTTSISTRRGKRLHFDEQENIAKVSIAEPMSNKSKQKEKKIVGESVTSISNSDSKSSDEGPSINKRRRQVADKNIVEDKGAAPNSKMKRIQQEITSSPLSTPERIRRIQKPKIVFTMLDDPKLETLIRSLGGTVVDTVKSCSVLVTGSLKRSQKLLAAVGEAKPICGPDWLHASKKAGKFLDPWEHILNDKEAEEKWNFSLKESLSRSGNQKLLTGYSFHILTTNHVDVLKAAVESCGGKTVNRILTKNADNTIIIGDPDYKTKYLKFLKQKPPVKVVAPEAIFDGVLRQELHWNAHLLS